MKNFKYYIPFIGLYFIHKDIPHTEKERPYKPLQGDEAFEIMSKHALIVFIFLFILALIQ